MQVWLIEININPALTINCDVLVQTIPPIVEEALGIVPLHFQLWWGGVGEGGRQMYWAK